MLKSEEQSLRLIDEYRKRECLWNTNDKNYYKRPKKLEAWNEIAAIFELEPENGAKTCENKMMSLLASYRREVRKEEKTKGDTGKVYKSRWFGMTAFAFLQDRNKVKKGVSTLEIQDHKYNGFDDSQVSLNVTTNNDHGRSSSKKFRKAASTAIETPEVEKQKLVMMNEALDILKQASSLVPVSTPASATTTDELRLFTDLAHAKIMKLSEKAKRRVQREINEILYAAEDGVYDQPEIENSDRQ